VNSDHQTIHRVELVTAMKQIFEHGLAVTVLPAFSMRARLRGVICPGKTPVYFDPQGPIKRVIS
jgi:hypothetical protein